MPGALERFVTRCRAAGLVLTPQRLTVFRHLAAGHGHPSAEELHAAVRRELPTLSLATVYKTLDSLARVGAVRRVRGAGARGRWDAGLESHHHLVCIECGSVRDVHDARLDAVKRRAAVLAGRHGFAASSHVVDILGRCAACQAAPRAPAARRRARNRRNSHGGRRRR